MAKTIMISNDLYKRLKATKQNRSFTETIRDLLEKPKKKTGADLAKCVGILKGDREYGKIMEESRSYFKKWAKKYA